MSSPRADDLFDDIEKDILRRYFGLKPRLPLDRIREGAVDADEPEEDDDVLRDGRRGVRLRDVKNLDREDVSLPDAVARICLNAVRSRLPTWTGMTKDGFVSARRPERKRAAQVPMLPRRLFGIDWVMSAPGLDWPETYHATFLPGFDRWVVTASYDSAETWGASDLALGWFRPREGFEEGCRGCITAHWEHQRDNYGQEPWEFVIEASAITQETALRWRDEVWAENRDEVDEDEAAAG